MTGAAIGRQQSAKDPSHAADSYRHAFLIREQKKADGKKTSTGEDVDHILCAESDIERDDWVRVLAAWHSGDYTEPQTDRSAPALVEVPSARKNASRQRDENIVASASDPQVYSPDPQDSMQPPSFANNHKREDSMGNTSTLSLSREEEYSNAAGNAARLMSRKRDLADIPPSSSLPNLDTFARPSLTVDGPPIRPSSEMGHYADLKDSPNHGLLNASARPATQRTDSGQSVPSSEHTTSSLAASGNRPASPDKRTNAKISGPMNGAPIKDTFKQQPRSVDDRRTRVKSSFWNFAGRSGAHYCSILPTQADTRCRQASSASCSARCASATCVRRAFARCDSYSSCSRGLRAACCHLSMRGVSRGQIGRNRGGFISPFVRSLV